MKKSSVAFRVNSLRAIQFRQWAVGILKDFAVRGYVLDKERLKNGSFFNKVSKEVAKAFAESEFEKYRIVQDHLFESDFDKHIKYALESGQTVLI